MGASHPKGTSHKRAHPKPTPPPSTSHPRIPLSSYAQQHQPAARPLPLASPLSNTLPALATPSQHLETGPQRHAAATQTSHPRRYVAQHIYVVFTWRGHFWARKNPPHLAFTRGNGFLSLAVTEGFEPSVRGYRTQHFECCTFGRSDTSPNSGNFTLDTLVTQLSGASKQGSSSECNRRW